VSKKKISTIDLIEQASLEDLIRLFSTVLILMFGVTIGIFSIYKTQYFADAYQFMNGLRNLFNLLLSNMIAYPDVQTPELISNLYNIMIFNFIYTNLILMSDPSFLTTLFGLPPNPSIQDVIFGFSIVIYFTLYLIDYIYGEQLNLPRSNNLKILFLIVSVSISVILIGLMFMDWVIISLSVLILILSFVIVGLWLPLGSNAKELKKDSTD